MKYEMQVALVIDDYKIEHKDGLWKAALDKAPLIRDNYELVHEEKRPGPAHNTTIFKRTYRLKGAQ
jgi:hypothetical protein